MTFTKERRIRDHCSFVSSLFSRVFFACAILNERKRSDSKPPNRLRRVAFFVRTFFPFFPRSVNPNSIKTLTFLPPCVFLLIFRAEFCVSEKDEHFFNQIKHTCFCFLIISTQRRRERQTDSESSRYGTHTHARAHISSRSLLFCVGYLVFYNSAQRERKRERTRV